jgi:hypothetical protein
VTRWPEGLTNANLIPRLRGAAQAGREKIESWDHDPDLYDEAADRIEQLTRALEIIHGKTRKVEIGEDLKPLPVRKKGEVVEWLTIAAEKVMELAGEGNAWAVEHVANRMDGKVREQVEITTTTSMKIRYGSYEEVRAALLDEGINIDQLPMLTDMRTPKGQERS